MERDLWLVFLGGVALGGAALLLIRHMVNQVDEERRQCGKDR